MRHMYCTLSIKSGHAIRISFAFVVVKCFRNFVRRASVVLSRIDIRAARLDMCTLSFRVVSPNNFVVQLRRFALNFDNALLVGCGDRPDYLHGGPAAAIDGITQPWAKLAGSRFGPNESNLCWRHVSQRVFSSCRFVRCHHECMELCFAQSGQRQPCCSVNR